MNPSALIHREHPKIFQFRAYHPLNEWGDFLISLDELGNREMEGMWKKDTIFKSNIIY